MCGICGVLKLAAHDESAESLPNMARRMAETMVHRGPDGFGEWTDSSAGVALAHRRLAVIDLSALGAQPMSSKCGRFVCVYNGEIYNHRELRNMLEPRGHKFRGHSDTEVLLAAVAEWGTVEALQQLNGMFAFAIWDRDEQQLLLARDRMGEKPLYYCWIGSSLVFASELKAIRSLPGASSTVNSAALAEYMRRGYIPAPLTILEGVSKLLPGTYLQIGRQAATRETLPERYWSLSEVAAEGLRDPLAHSMDELQIELESLLRDAVQRRTIADVDVGVFLSGGIDSSLVAALMQSQSATAIRSFSIGFHESRYDEAPFARAIAHHLGTQHTELYIDFDDARTIVPDLPSIYDEPFGDSSAIPTVILSRLTRDYVTVALSGDGGDELFGGYSRYQSAGRVWQRTRGIPKAVREPIATMVRRGPRAAWDSLPVAATRRLPKALGTASLGRRMAQLASACKAEHAVAFYDAFTAQWIDDDIVRTPCLSSPVPSESAHLANADFMSEAMLRDSGLYMPDDVLVKVDRASMAASLEVRVPLLDPRVVRFAWRVPPHARTCRGAGKWPLRRLLGKYVPRRLTDRAKRGFAVPVDDWLRGPLRSWGEDLLDPALLKRDGYLNCKRIRKAWAEHQDGNGYWRDPLWIALMFQAWLHRDGR